MSININREKSREEEDYNNFPFSFILVFFGSLEVNEMEREESLHDKSRDESFRHRNEKAMGRV